MLAAFPEYSGYKGWLIKLNSPPNLQRVEIIIPRQASGTVWVSERGKQLCTRWTQNIVGDASMVRNYNLWPYSRLDEVTYYFVEDSNPIQPLINTQITYPEGT